MLPSDKPFVVNYSGHEVVYKVPAGVSKMTVKMWGAGGGFGGDSGLDYLSTQNNNSGGAGGKYNHFPGIIFLLRDPDQASLH